MARTAIIAVFGGGGPKAPLDLATAIGRALAERHVVVLTGGRGGVMKGAAKGALEAGGHTVGILPWAAPEEEQKANKYVEHAVYTGLDEGRNFLNVLVCDGAVAMAGGAGTLTEVAFAHKLERPLVYLAAWKFLNGKGIGLGACPFVEHAQEAAAAVMEQVQIDPGQTWADRFAAMAVRGQEENLRRLRERLEAWDRQAAKNTGSGLKT
jgi:uncharacterized protein (TIGR00725 family)